MPFRHFLLSVLVAVTFSRESGVAGDDFRYWYDRDCKTRIHADIRDLKPDIVHLSKSDGDSHSAVIADLSYADGVFLDAYRLCTDAANRFDDSPYADGERALERFRTYLAKSDNVSPRAAQSLTRSHNTANERQLSGIRRQYVAINGVACEVASVNVSEFALGISDIRVELDNGRRVVITPSMADELVLLPGYRKPLNYPRASIGDDGFQSRSPPASFSLAPEFKWKYTLVYDYTEHVWTDVGSVRAHQLLARAKSLLGQAAFLNEVAEARWNIHRGRALAAEGKSSDALNAFAKAIELSPDYAEAYLERALVLLHGTAPAPAVDAAATAIRCVVEQIRNDVDPQRLIYAYGAYDVLSASLETKATAHSRGKQHRQAVAEAEAALRICPPSKSDHFRKLIGSLRAVAADDYASRAEAFLAIIRTGGTPKEFEYASATSAARLAADFNPDSMNGKYAQLSVACRTAAAEFYHASAAAAAAEANFAAAVRYSAKAIEQNPNPGEMKFEQSLAAHQAELQTQKTAAGNQYLSQARTALADKSYDEAVACGQGAIDILPDELKKDATPILTDAHFRRGQSRFGERSYGKAAEDFTAVLKLDPKHVNALYYRAFSHFRGEKYAESVADLNDVVTADPQRHGALHLRAFIFRIQGRHQDSVTDLTKAIELDSSKARYHFDRAIAHRSLGDDAAALADVSAAIQREGDEAEYFLLRAQLRGRDLDTMIADAGTAIRLDPSSQEAREVSSRLQTRQLELREAAYREQQRLAQAAAREEQRLQQWAYQEELRKQQSDPYYFNEGRARPAAAKLVGAVLMGVLKRGALNQAFETDDGLEALINLGFAAGGHILQDRAIESAIQDVFPNLPPAEKSVLSALISEVIDAALSGRAPTGMEFLTGVGTGASKNAMKDWLENNHPNLRGSAEVADFLLLIIGEANRRNGQGSFTPYPTHLQYVQRYSPVTPANAGLPLVAQERSGAFPSARLDGDVGLVVAP